MLQRLATLALGLTLCGPAAARADIPAKQLFGAKARPAELATRSIGFYSRGCIAGAAQMPVDGKYWQAMRLSRNRNWGHPVLVEYLEWLAREAAQKDGWPGLLIGDMSQPRGGPMLTGHASHQVGLDADIWLMPMPDRRLTEKEREEISAVAVTQEGPHEVFPRRWTDAHFRLIKRAASDERVERIFVAPGIKKKLCETEKGSRGWLAKVRPYYGHNYHFHIRMVCPPGSPQCKPQGGPPKGDGCGAPLAWWFGKEPYKPKPPPDPNKKPREIMLSNLPAACRGVLEAGNVPGTAAAVDAFYGRPTPDDHDALAAALASQPMESKLPIPLSPKPRPAGQ